MNVLGHDDVAIYADFEAASYPFESFFEGLLRRDRNEQWPAVITAESNEVSLAGLVKTLQSPGHTVSLVSTTAPLKQKKLEWATGGKTLDSLITCC